MGGVLEVHPDPCFDDAQRACIDRIAATLEASEPVVIIIEGPQEIGKRTAAAVAAQVARRRLIHIDATRLSSGSTGASELDSAFSAMRRECLLSGALPLIAQVDALSDARSEAAFRPLARLLDETPISVLLTSSEPGLDLGMLRKVLRITMKEPDIATRGLLWQREIEDPAAVDLELLAVRYHLGAGGIRRAASVARLLAGNEAPTTHHLVAGVRNGIAERLGSLALRVEVKQSWDDLVLSADTLDQIKSIVARVRHGHLVHQEWGFSTTLPRGTGTAALFSGPPGTGKTMVAGLIARELDLELYQVDLSKVVSKWVGETEKQLAKIFDAAEAGHALILFDEADSLFAKRMCPYAGGQVQFSGLAAA